MILCRDVYHCTPSQLAKEDYKTIRLHMAFLDAEQENKKLNSPNKPMVTGGKKKKK